MPRLINVLLVVVMVLLVVGIILANGRQPEPFPEGSQAARWLRPGPHAVQVEEAEFVDSNRATMANGDFPGESVRRFTGRIWYPADNGGGPYPLLVYSHGFTSSFEGGAYLAEHLAGLGYVVVSVSYPLTHMGAPGGPNARDVVNQPADVSFLIDTLLARSARGDSRLQGMVDPRRIGVTGISLGGLTTTLVAFHPEWRDPRIGAALSIAGPTSLFTPHFFSGARVPFLMLAGDIDALVPYRSNAAPVPEIVPGGELVTIAGGSHTAFSGPSAPLRWLDNPDAIGCFAVMQNIGAIDEEPWYDRLGTPEQGINYNAVNELCQVDPLPASINVLRQQMITTLVVSAFFESHFAAQAATRAVARRFLVETLAAELAEVSYVAASAAVGQAGESAELALE